MRKTYRDTPKGHCVHSERDESETPQDMGSRARTSAMIEADSALGVGLPANEQPSNGTLTIPNHRHDRSCILLGGATISEHAKHRLLD